MPFRGEQELGAFLRARRERLDAAGLGFDTARRRTPGLRREEVAARANVSSTWYTWLEQGRGGGPSAEVLDRICNALLLTDAERAHAFMLALGRPPEPSYRPPEGIEPKLQRVLDSFETSPALIKTATWDIVAWNRVSVAVFGDYEKLPARDRNILKLLFLYKTMRPPFAVWREMARFVVATFRADAIRAGAGRYIVELVQELREASPEFAAMWDENEVGDGVGAPRRFQQSRVGEIELDGTIFRVAGRQDLSLVVHCPVRPEDAERIKRLLAMGHDASFGRSASRHAAEGEADEPIIRQGHP
jgi:hypothetical protein